MISGRADGNVRIWSAPNGQRRHTLRGHEGRVWSVAFSPDETLLASGGADSSICLWDTSTGERESPSPAPAVTSPHSRFTPGCRCWPAVARMALSRIGQDLHSLGRLEEAAAALQAAMEIQHTLHQTVWAIESTAELAVTYVDMAQPAQALALVDALLPDVQTNSALHGAREPFRVYWNCYSVPAANRDSRGADLLAAAYAGLRGQADNIQDPTLRWSFVENVPVHRSIAQTIS